MTDAKLLKTKITAIIDGHSELPEFGATGSRLLFPGWLAVDTGARGEDIELPYVKKEKVKIT